MIGAAICLSEHEPLAATLFGEAPSRVIVTAAQHDLTTIAELAKAHDVPMRVIGATGGDRLILMRGERAIVDLPLAALRDARERCLDPIVHT